MEEAKVITEEDLIELEIENNEEIKTMGKGDDEPDGNE